MTKGNILILLFLFIYANLFAQRISRNLFDQRIDNDTAKTIERYAHEIDSSNVEFDSFKFSIDSIQVDVKVYSDKIVTSNFFENSKSNLTVSFYFKENKLVEAKVSEQSTIYNELYRYSFFYFENDRIFYTYYYGLRRIGIAIPVDKIDYDPYGYNRNLEDGFLKKYIIILYNRIKTTARKKLNKKLITELPKDI